MSEGCDTRASEKLEGGQEAVLRGGGGVVVTTFCEFVFCDRKEEPLIFHFMSSD